MKGMKPPSPWYNAFNIASHRNCARQHKFNSINPIAECDLERALLVVVVVVVVVGVGVTAASRGTLDGVPRTP